MTERKASATTTAKATARANAGISPLRRKSAPSVEMTINELGVIVVRRWVLVDRWALVGG
jgi:hypothetical protein